MKVQTHLDHLRESQLAVELAERLDGQADDIALGDAAMGDDLLQLFLPHQEAEALPVTRAR